MLNDVALFDRIYIRALIFLQLQLLRESFPDNNRGRCVTNFFPTKSGGWRGKKIIKCDDEKKPKTLFSPLFSFSLSLALLSCLGAAKWAERKEEMQRLKKNEKIIKCCVFSRRLTFNFCLLLAPPFSLFRLTANTQQQQHTLSLSLSVCLLPEACYLYHWMYTFLHKKTVVVNWLLRFLFHLCVCV